MRIHKVCSECTLYFYLLIYNLLKKRGGGLMQLLNVKKVYHNKMTEVLALDYVSLCLNEKGMTFIIGPSGCGKTTLLNIMAGRDHNYEGNVIVDGNVEYLTQTPNFFDDMSIIDNLLVVNDDKKLILELLVKYDLKNPYQKVKRCSVGEKKRLQIIRALLSEASFVLCDEPTAALDYDNQHMVMNALQEVSVNRAVVIVTHQISLVELYANRIIKMGKGCILEDFYVSDSFSLEINKVSQSKRINNYIFYITKKMKSRKIETLFQLCTFTILMLVIYVGMFLFSDFRHSTLSWLRWNNGNNVIITQPIESLNQYEDNISQMGIYREYDLYQYDDVKLAKSNVKGLLGYKIGWDIYKYDISPLGSSFIPKVNVDEMRTIVDLYEDDFLKTNIEPFPFYKQNYELISNYNQQNFNKAFPMYLNYRGLNFNDYGDSILGPIPYIQSIQINQINDTISPYELYEDVSLELICGNMPKQNEVLLSKSVADLLMSKWGLDTYEQLLSKTLDITISGYDIRVQGQVTYTVPICGVTYAYSNKENQVYFKQQEYTKMLESFFKFDSSIATFTFITFLVDPIYDEYSISEKLNILLDSDKSEFIPSYTLESELFEVYQNPYIMGVFVAFIIVSIIGVIVAKEFIYKNRNLKELTLLEQYCYRPFYINIL